MTDQFNLRQALIEIRNLRNAVPVFNPRDEESKDLIQAYQTTLFDKVTQIQQALGFENYEKTLIFVDTEIPMLGLSA
jgi:hypothetical protein